MGSWRFTIRSGLAAALSCACTLVPLGQAFGSRDEDLFLRDEDLRTVLFGSLDGGRSLFVSGGLKRALTGPLDRTGFIVMDTSGLGVTRERYDATPGIGAVRLTTETASLLGYQWVVPGLYTAVLAGPELRQEQLDVALAHRVSKPRLGGRVHAELWSNPTPDTLLTGTVVAGSTRGSLWGRVSAGYRVWRNAYVGPEVAAYVTDTYRETKFGLHVTGIDLGIVHLRLSGGLQFQDDRRDAAPYVALTSWIRL